MTAPNKSTCLSLVLSTTRLIPSSTFPPSFCAFTPPYRLLLSRITSGTHFRELCYGLLPLEASKDPYSIVRSPGGAFERLQDPEEAPGSSTRLMGITAGMRIWCEDGVRLVPCE